MVINCFEGGCHKNLTLIWLISRVASYSSPLKYIDMLEGWRCIKSLINFLLLTDKQVTNIVKKDDQSDCSSQVVVTKLYNDIDTGIFVQIDINK